MSTASANILIVDDLVSNLKILRDTLESQNYGILAASDGPTALRVATGYSPDLILLDVMMPGMDGYEVCHLLKENTHTEHIPVIFISAREDGDSVLEAFRAGGVDYVCKPFEREEVLARVKTHLGMNRLTRELLEKNGELSRLTQELLQKNQALEQEIERRKLEQSARAQAESALKVADDRLNIITHRDLRGMEGFVGKSRSISDIFTNVRRLQDAEKTSVLITGESGTGKELIARAIHFGGALAKAPFVAVNCSAIPDHLAESAFFGHVKGAFTGATANHKGYFELANGGTLFLDEIGDMQLFLQSKLLRVLEDGTMISVGDTKQKEVTVRIVAATNQDLERSIADKSFRSDLYFRLAGFPIKLPPLRERKEDIPLLASHFLSQLAADMGMVVNEGDSAPLSAEAMDALMSYDFPGNIRELKNIIEHALIRNGGAVIQPAHLHFVDVSVRSSGVANVEESEPPATASAEFKAAETKVIQRAQKRSEGNGDADTDHDDPGTEEGRILDYLRTHESISNTECRELLKIERRRANYLLDKLCKYKLVVCEGEFRWRRYKLATDGEQTD